ICLVDDHRPVFISSGFLTDIELALKISMETTIKNKQPEPIFKADQISRKLIQNNKDTKGE
ncbi:MAG: hypothetical protein KGD57_07770, partial [Candidatus Lokiarchaeota archaeon]|nr:hypothetical protein [Candidatus Lokiarchaeota archaeon]